MKRTLTILGILVLAFSIAAGPAGAKKKKTYCQKQGSSAKAKLKMKRNGFYVFLEKSKYSFMICQDKPKFRASFSLPARGDKMSQLRVIKKKCAVFAARGSSHNPQVFRFDFKNFTSNNGQASVYEVGYNQGPSTLLSLGLSSNCVSAYGQRVNGVPGISVQGLGTFGYTGLVSAPVGKDATDKELAAAKIAGSADSATVTWTEAGVAKSFVYNKPAGY